MASGSAIFNESQTYGNGIIQMQGSFTDNGTAPVVTHGKGFKVARATTAGCYLVTLTPGFQGIHSLQADVNAPASVGNGSFSHPGFMVCGDLQSNNSQNNQFYLYAYSFAGTQQFMAATNTICQFAMIASISALNP